MRQKIVAGNWKMNTLIEEGAALAKNIADRINEVPSDVQLILAPPFTHLDRVNGIIKGTAAALSAQNCADKDKGAYTGEVSAAMLASTGCKYVILGHSERREYYHETSATLNDKMALALANGLKPIFCVGEKLEEREAGRHFDVVGAQIREVLFNLSPEQLAQVVSAPARPPHRTRPRRFTHLSARPWQRSTEPSPMRFRSSTAAAASPPTPASSSHRRTSTAA